MDDNVKIIWDVAEKYRPLGIPIRTPVKDFDDAMDGGVRNGEMITISGLSGEGKTSFALWLTKQISESNVPCLFFTYEMNPWYLKEKLVKMGCKDNLPIFVPIEHSGNQIEWLKERIVEAKDKFGCGVVFIDHLHYLIPENQEKNASLMIGGIARNIKQVAIETDTAIYLIAHMRKLDTGERVNHYAVRDSALIINESDYVFLVERLKRKKKRNSVDEDLLADDLTNYTKIHLSKNRRTGAVKNRFFEVENGRFIQLTEDKVKELKDKIEL
jgi:KaiC/GvpD/RAD55 family RecA-like ATPase